VMGNLQARPGRAEKISNAHRGTRTDATREVASAFGRVPGLHLRSHPCVAPCGSGVPLSVDTGGAAGVFSNGSLHRGGLRASVRASVLARAAGDFESRILATMC